MAAFETAWSDPMSSEFTGPSAAQQLEGSGDVAQYGGSHATVAAFSPNQQTASGRPNTPSIIIHQKSPLLMATPPQVTRALAYSHPFILPLNHLVGLISWTSGDPGESFLLVSAFWFFVLYGDNVLRWSGPIFVVAALIAGMYSRRYSPLSSTSWKTPKTKKKSGKDVSAKDARKSLDEILDTLQTFSGRCDVLLDPFLQMTEFLSTQSSATSASTRPALTTLFIRILAFTPIWVFLTLPPLQIITTRRVVLTVGTLILTWHSRPARVSRSILWRSRSVRAIATLITGLHFTTTGLLLSKKHKMPPMSTAMMNTAKARNVKAGVRFTFSVNENQRRWLGLGWTTSLFPYERSSWTDDQQNPSLSTENFMLPDTGSKTARWRWVPGSEWRIEVPSTEGDEEKIVDDEGWTYSDNQWHGPSKEDSWGKYTRRRKWVRDGELLELAEEPKRASTAPITSSTPAPTKTASTTTGAEKPGKEGSSAEKAKRRSGWFGKKTNSSKTLSALGEEKDRSDVGSASGSGKSTRPRSDGEDDVLLASHHYRSNEFDRSIGDGLAEGLS